MGEKAPAVTVDRMETLMPLIRELLENKQSVRLQPRGTSMLPMLRQDIDSVVLSPLPPALKKYDLPLYRRDNGKYILHRIIGVGETYTCMGDNQFTAETGVRPDQMIALVTGFYRGDKYRSADRPGYWLYCRTWHYSRPLRCLWRRAIGWLRRKLIRIFL